MQGSFDMRNDSLTETATQSSSRSESQTGLDLVSRFFDTLKGQKPPLATKPSGERLSIDSPLIHELKSIFHDKELCKKLMGCQASDAQLLLDSFQHLLDRIDLDLPFRKELMVNTQRLSSKAGLYPTCYKLKGVTGVGEHPVVSGGAADIYKGLFQHQVVCLKTIRVYETCRIDDMLKKFWKEAMLWGQLSHPNVLAIYGLYRHKNRLCIVAPWMRNGHIGQYLEETPNAPRARLALDVGSGLMYLHNNDIVHGDLKSLNVLVDGTGRARLTDFGISSVLDVSLEWTTKQAYASEGGTLRWRAPEVLQAERSVTVRNSKESDMYAWGCVAWEIFTGRFPFPEIGKDAVSHHIMIGERQRHPDPSDRAWKDFGLTEEIWACMDQCWEREPSKRPSATTIVQHFKAKLTTVDPRPIPKADELSPPEFRRKMSGGFKLITTEALKRIIWQGQEFMRARGGNWTKEIHSDDIFLEDGRSGDLIIPVMGHTGTGRSTFINTLLGYEAAPVGRTLHSETAHLQTYLLPDGARRIFIVDTPGFDHSDMSDQEILRRFAVWMAKSYCDGMKVAGIIYLHNIAQRIHGASWKNLDMFAKLCGPAAFTNITLATTMWSQVERSVGEQREAQFCEALWKDMLRDGSRVRRFEESQVSAQAIVMEIIEGKPLDAIQIQSELVKADKLFAETQVGRTLYSTLKKLLKDHKAIALHLRRDSDGGDNVRGRIIMNDHKIQALTQQLQGLEIPLNRKLMYKVG